MQKRGLRVWAVRSFWALTCLLVLALLAVGATLCASMAQLDGTRRVPGLHGPVSVARDDHGVPLLQASNRDDLAYATGFVHAQDRFFQMDLLRRSGAGELAELFGARAVPLDKARRLHRFRARAERMLGALPAGERAFLECYAAGINDGLNALGARPFEYVLLGTAPRPWRAVDSLLVGWAMFFDLQGGQEARALARGWIAGNTDAAQFAFLLPESSEWDAPLDATINGTLDVTRLAASSPPIPPHAPPWWGQRRSGAPIRSAAATFTDAIGSNNWALAGSRSVDGAAIVSHDMHLGLQLPSTWYRLALQFPDADGKQRRMVGLTLPGAPPFVTVGSNGHVAWGYTNAYADLLELVALDIDPSNPARARSPAGWESLSRHVETILVKGAPAQELVVRESAFGPLREAGARTYAIHWIAHLPGALNFNQRLLETADTLAQALAVATTVGIPAQNFVAGDERGNIGWTITGMLAHRPPGTGVARLWDGPLAPAEYPMVINPASGQLSTANSRQLMGAGARLIGDGGFDLGARNRQVSEALRALGPGSDLPAVYRITLDDRALFMAGWRERAIATLDAQAIAGQPRRAEFLRLLRTSWSGRASVDSSGYRLARGFMWALHALLFGAANEAMAAIDVKAGMPAASARWPVVLARLLDAQPAPWLPAGYPSWQALELAAIDQVIADLTADGQVLADATWGARNTVAIAHPISMAAPALRRYLSAPADQLPGDANMPRVAGPAFGQSERLTVSPGKEEQGVFNMPDGQSGHPLSPYFLRGHAQWVAGATVPLLPGPARHTLRFEPQENRGQTAGK
ncbi:MAG: penicillin acylase family protein [Massilia sp.]|nr:penicillin acylase family protein [Massilia sp.]